MIATSVFVDGPYTNAGPWSDWEEVPEFTVNLQDDDGEIVGKVYRCGSYSKACSLGEKMARDRNLELIIEASPVSGWGW